MKRGDLGDGKRDGDGDGSSEGPCGCTADEVARKVIEAYEALGGRGKPQGQEWTCVAGVVACTCTDTGIRQEGVATSGKRGKRVATCNMEVVCLATGTKCTGLDRILPDGSVVHDCHAEVLTRRALRLHLWREVGGIVGCLSKATGEIEEKRKREGEHEEGGGEEDTATACAAAVASSSASMKGGMEADFCPVEQQGGAEKGGEGTQGISSSSSSYHANCPTLDSVAALLKTFVSKIGPGVGSKGGTGADCAPSSRAASSVAVPETSPLPPLPLLEVVLERPLPSVGGGGGGGGGGGRQMRKYSSDDLVSLFSSLSFRLRLRKDVRLHFYVSQVPCGEAALVPLPLVEPSFVQSSLSLSLCAGEVQGGRGVSGRNKGTGRAKEGEGSPGRDPKRESGEGDGFLAGGVGETGEGRESEEDTEGRDRERGKMEVSEGKKGVERRTEEKGREKGRGSGREEDVWRTGAKVAFGEEEDPREEGGNFHGRGRLRWKAGRSDLPPRRRTVSFSCSDKLRRWGGLGWQGGILSGVLGRRLALRVSRSRRAERTTRKTFRRGGEGSEQAIVELERGLRSYGVFCRIVSSPGEGSFCSAESSVPISTLVIGGAVFDSKLAKECLVPRTEVPSETRSVRIARTSVVFPRSREAMASEACPPLGRGGKRAKEEKHVDYVDASAFMATDEQGGIGEREKGSGFPPPQSSPSPAAGTSIVWLTASSAIASPCCRFALADFIVSQTGRRHGVKGGKAKKEKTQQEQGVNGKWAVSANQREKTAKSKDTEGVPVSSLLNASPFPPTTTPVLPPHAPMVSKAFTARLATLILSALTPSEKNSPHLPSGLGRQSSPDLSRVSGKRKHEDGDVDRGDVGASDCAPEKEEDRLLKRARGCIADPTDTPTGTDFLQPTGTESQKVGLDGGNFSSQEGSSNRFTYMALKNLGEHYQKAKRTFSLQGGLSGRPLSSVSVLERGSEEDEGTGEVDWECRDGVRDGRADRGGGSEPSLLGKTCPRWPRKVGLPSDHPFVLNSDPGFSFDAFEVDQFPAHFVLDFVT
uniref:tRNA-specific adenosine deaminase 1 n=1 Tax=Chromera velia CCMP2878 TaxID=1169474 RepID=A0A0G4FFH3_9ALVE|eukprot:Cvel_16602.t1-p1 / transcript=Cvel_16602.t1 / gene=Cvel_16602 / organism=Chromera_velia_CCMP2878 / gene_product=tRNA-specific adenosine deaminase 1, putative / transcript_product=tRNA-specific adenosine deaminase 1, putative / location=Cvel_scaffold1286:9837-15479(-) / protein_length=1041 / sequence_SO=supercontig / SO=protein_coding / is_pseudo=false